MEWDGGTACISGTCDSSGIACTCVPNHHLGCYDEDVYWFDSCNAAGAFSLDCGEDELTGPLFCQSGDVYQQLIDRTCVGAACTELTASQKVVDCGTAGCSSSVCCASETTSKCYGGDLYFYSSCNVRQGKDQDCGTAGCESNECCSSNDTLKCYDGDVYNYSSCDVRQSKEIDCGNSVEGAPYCVGNIVKRTDTIRGCTGSSCTQTTQTVTVQDCGTKKECHSGVCVCPSLTPWNNNLLYVSNVTGGKKFTWSAPSPNWVQTFYIARAPGSMTPPPGWSIGSTDGTTITDYTGSPGQCYNYVVYAYNACGQQKNVSQVINECW